MLPNTWVAVGLGASLGVAPKRLVGGSSSFLLLLKPSEATSYVRVREDIVSCSVSETPVSKPGFAVAPQSTANDHYGDLNPTPRTSKPEPQALETTP